MVGDPTRQVLPVVRLSKSQAAAELQAVQRRRAADAAYEAELILRMADLTPCSPTPTAGKPAARTCAACAAPITG